MVQATNSPNKLAEVNFLEQYSLGEKKFIQAQLENINLENKTLDYLELIKANLSNANFKNTSFNESDFRESNLSNTNFKFSSIKNVNFSNANLQKSKFSLAKLINVNFTGACLKNTSLYCAELEEIDFSYADLRSTYLNGIDLSKVNFQKAFYNDETKFSPEFNPVEAGMIHELNIETLDSLIKRFNRLGALSKIYLGSMMTKKYFYSSRPEHDWLNILNMNQSNYIYISEAELEPLNPLQLYWLEEWMNSFTYSCSKIFKNFQSMI